MPITLSNQQKGYLYAFVATITLSNVYIFSKAALNEMQLAQFGFYWFGFAIIWNLTFTVATSKHKQFKPLTKFQVRNLLGIGIMEIIATVSIFTAIKIIPNPTIPSMLRNLEPVLIVILASLILNEKYNRVEKMGIVLTLLGTVVISYNNLGDIRHFFINGVEFVIIGCFFYAFRTIWSKKVIHHFTAVALNLNKIVFLFITSVIALIISKQGIYINKAGLINVAIGSIIGPFLTSYAQFMSFKFIDASRSTLVQSTAGFITLILSYLYFGRLPHGYQVIGAGVTIIGLSILTIKKSKHSAINKI